MELEQALQTIEQALQAVQANRQTHITLQEAFTVVAETCRATQVSENGKGKMKHEPASH